MYKRKGEQGGRMSHGHNEINKQGRVEGDSEQASPASGPMREPTHRGEGGSSVSWQQRTYECQFCKRGFTSAQALGGHMNVHRRDRALGRSGFHGIPTSNRRNDNSNNSNSSNHVSILQPRGHVGKARASFIIGSATSIYIPHDQASAAAAAATAAQPSSFFPHVAARDNRENYRPELCIDCSSKDTHIIDQPNLRMEWHKPAVTDDGEVDLELRLGEKP